VFVLQLNFNQAKPAVLKGSHDAHVETNSDQTTQPKTMNIIEWAMIISCAAVETNAIV
jgi:hypothetical protein